MNKKLAVLLIAAGGLAIISVSHLVSNTTNVTESTTEIEHYVQDSINWSLVSESQKIAELTQSPNPMEVLMLSQDEEDTEPEIEFSETDELVYTTSRVNLRVEPNTSCEIYKTINYSTHLHRVGYSEDGWSIISIDGGEYYICNDYIRVATQERLGDIELLARIIHSESGNQCLEGQRAVGSVVYNRWHYEGYGGSDTILGVITYPGQFNGYQSKQWYEDYSEATYQIASEVYDGHTNTPSNVRNFKTNDCNADWDYAVWDVIGDHTFYYSD